ncbi:alpha/beta fold hydrolase [Gordonia sp. ABSL1-1]|uniref:alpha/beta fold hydrolase n=1 Tax=Gordonia sp. ABSL1-1 TaxID=3053923 RepID=UPI002572EDFC|nr:alpha/beta hydrolase [Gordonia sp. ABSL1-1]MDL9936811.1 alpha/beta fold hydrolase [Gordonia sp. ABSL1-1]
MTLSDQAQFDQAYDALLQQWPNRQSLDVTTAHGTTCVHICTPASGADEVPVVLLSGGGATSTAYTPIVGALAAHRRVIGVDLICDLGRSRPVAGRPHDTADLLNWLAAVLDELGVERIDLVGHSYGAMIALAFALGNHRDRVRNLVLLDPSSCFAGMRAGYLWHALPTLLRPSSARQRRFLAWETQHADLTAAGLDADWVTVACAGAALPTPKLIVPKRPKAAQLGGLTAALTVILAPRSRIHNPATIADRVRASIPAARVITLTAGSHHTLPLAPADELADALSAALTAGMQQQPDQ